MMASATSGIGVSPDSPGSLERGACCLYVRFDGRPDILLTVQMIASEIKGHMSDSYAVVIAIENYQQPGMLPVKYAAADARAFRDALIQRFHVPEQNIQLWIDSDATQNRLLNDLPYEIKQLNAGDRFFFFYAGHGFYSKGSNRLSTWDSHPSNLEGTTVDIEPVLLQPLKRGKCSRNLIFIDACAKGLDAEHANARDVLADLRPEEFEELVLESQYSAAFFSCSPNERSYSFDKLQHGIWSFFLLQALNGEADDAIHRDDWITGESLKAYLRLRVRNYIREETDLRGQQTPYAALHGDGLVEILQVPRQTASGGTLPLLKLAFDKARFRQVQTRSYRSMDGFDKKRGNTEPTSHSASASSWAKRLVRDELAVELESIKKKAREVLQVGRADLSLKLAEDAGGSLDSDFFRYSITADQDGMDPAYIAVTRDLILRVPYQQLPVDFDSIFDRPADEIQIPFNASEIDFDELANYLEQYARQIGGQFDEQESKDLITLILPHGGLELNFDFEGQSLNVGRSTTRGTLKLIAAMNEASATQLLGPPPKLLGAPKKIGVASKSRPTR